MGGNDLQCRGTSPSWALRGYGARPADQDVKSQGLEGFGGMMAPLGVETTIDVTGLLEISASDPRIIRRCGLLTTLKALFWLAGHECVSLRTFRAQNLLGQCGGNLSVGVSVEMHPAQEMVPILIEKTDDVDKWQILGLGPNFKVTHQSIVD